jgi:hypothetical protein
MMTYILSYTEDGPECPDDLELYIRNHYIEFRSKRVLLAEQQKLADSLLKKVGVLPTEGDNPPEEKKPTEGTTTSDCDADFGEAPFDAFKLLEPIQEKTLAAVTTSSSASTTVKVKIEEAKMLEEILDESAASASQSSDNLLTVDCGATGSLLSMSTLALWEQGNLAKVRKIDPEVRKRYRVANGEVVTTDSQATVLFTQHPGLGPIEFDLTEQEGVPSLLGMNFLNNALSTLRDAY